MTYIINDQPIEAESFAEAKFIAREQAEDSNELADLEWNGFELPEEDVTGRRFLKQYKA